MKILRKRRGFSTNSSSSFEWVPPDATDTAGAVSSSPASATAPATATATVNPATTTSQTAQPVTLPITSPAPVLSGNNPVFGIGLVGVLICGLFVVEEVIRRLWKKFKGKQHED